MPILSCGIKGVKCQRPLKRKQDISSRCVEMLGLFTTCTLAPYWGNPWESQVENEVKIPDRLNTAYYNTQGNT